jgi:O-antigen ligase
LAAIVISYARGATLTTAVLVLLWLVGWAIVEWRRQTRQPWIIAISGLVLLGVVYSSVGVLDYQGAWDRIETGLAGGGDLSVQTRRASASATLTMAADHQPWGVGAGAFAFTFPTYAQRDPMLWGNPQAPNWWQQAHHDPIQFWAEYGVLGCTLILAGFLVLAWQFYRAQAWRRPLPLTLLSGLVACLFYSSLDFPLQCPAILVTLALLAALVLAERGQAEPCNDAR